MTYDPGLKYEMTTVLSVAEVGHNPDRIIWEREKLRAELADYPGVLLWEERAEGDRLYMTATKYPPDLADRLIARRRRDALRGEETA